MEIKIDTSKDSPEDIRNMIRFLQQFIEAGSTEQPDLSTEASEGLFGMFNEGYSSPDAPPEKAEEGEEPHFRIMPYE